MQNSFPPGIGTFPAGTLPSERCGILRRGSCRSSAPCADSITFLNVHWFWFCKSAFFETLSFGKSSRILFLWAMCSNLLACTPYALDNCLNDSDFSVLVHLSFGFAFSSIFVMLVFCLPLKCICGHSGLQNNLSCHPLPPRPQAAITSSYSAGPLHFLVSTS